MSVRFLSQRVQYENHTLTFNSNVCGGCEETIDLTATDTYSPTRIGGNSENGYEPWCNPCNLKVQVEMLVMNLELHFAGENEVGKSGMKIYDPGFHSSTWTIGWEEGPFEWTYSVQQVPAVAMNPTIHVEALNHWAIAIYPA